MVGDSSERPDMAAWAPGSAPDGLEPGDVARILQGLATSLAGESTVAGVTAAVARIGLVLPGDPAVTVGVADSPEGEFRIRALKGFDPSVLDRWATIDRSAPVPMARALVEKEPLYLESREELLARFPSLAEEIEGSGHHSWAVVPLVSTVGPSGVIGLAWSTARTLSETERLLLFTAATLGGESLRRALREEERRRLLLRVADAADLERLSIAADLHDDPVQRLAAVSIRLGSLRSVNRPIEPADLAGIEDSVHDVLGSLRDLIFDLHPPDVGRLTLGQAIEDYAGWLFGDDAITASVVDHIDRDLPAGHVRTIYRIVQEALTNVWKHAGAGRVSVHLGAGPEAVAIRIDDDGVGVAEAQNLRERGHVGLQTIRERAESLGGAMAIGSSPSGGFRVDVTLPLVGPDGASSGDG